jgi:ABC-2 type transport system permease protein
VSFATQARAVGRVCYFNGLLPLGRQPLLMIAGFLTPFSFLFFLFVIAPRALFPFGVVGGIVFTMLFTGNGMLNDCAYLRLERQLQQVFVASPMRPLGYVLGMALSELAFALPALASFMIILYLVRPFGAVGLVGLVGVLLLTWLMATTLGFLISTFFRQLREIWPIGTLVFSTLAVLPPIFYPIEAIPLPWRWVAFFAPSTFAAQFADRVVGLSSSTAFLPAALGSPAFDAVGLVLLTVLFGGAALFLARWREP